MTKNPLRKQNGLFVPDADFYSVILINGLDNSALTPGQEHPNVPVDWNNPWRNVVTGATSEILNCYLRNILVELPTHYIDEKFINSFIGVTSRRYKLQEKGIAESTTHLIRIDSIDFKAKEWYGSIRFTTFTKLWSLGFRVAYKAERQLQDSLVITPALNEILAPQPVEEIKRKIITKSPTAEIISKTEKPQIVLENLDYIVIDSFLTHVLKQPKDKQQVILEQIQKKLNDRD